MISYPTRGRNYDTQHEDFHNTDVPNQFKVYGALVGGPQSDDRWAASAPAAIACATPCLGALCAHWLFHLLLHGHGRGP